ncbi:Uncharacterized protein Rs2_03014 [Raphanus sativus]|nr:Uncharacterized protein Rs2_03014 [Raphanus sativus]
MFWVGTKLKYDTLGTSFTSCYDEGKHTAEMLTKTTTDALMLRWGHQSPRLEVQEQFLSTLTCRTKEDEKPDSNPLDDANLMVEGAVLSDSDLLVDVEEGEYQEWEQGEITDFMEEEEVVVQDNEAGNDVVEAQDQELEANEMGEEERDNNEEISEKPLKKKGAKPGPLAIGGSMKMRLVQSLVSPRKKNVAKMGAKQGDKGAGASKKATMKPKTSE